jgi:hypothetical protein
MTERLQPAHVVQALMSYLAEEPELRVGQALVHAVHHVYGHFDPFSIEDAQLASCLDALAAAPRRRKSTRT